MNPDELKNTVLNPEDRVLKRITITDALEAQKMISTLMGTDASLRREFIEQHSYLFNDD